MFPALDSDLLRTFLAVAETENVTRAADRLGRTQSAVSMQVRRLEDAVGMPLFDRGPRGVSMNGQGRRLLPYARRIVGLVEEAATAMVTAPLEGPVRVGIPEEYSRTILPQALAAFAESHPAVEVTVMCAYTAQQLRALESDELDLAVIFDCRDEADGEVLVVDPTVWVASSVHDRHLQRPLPIAVYWESNWCRDFALRSLELYGIPHRIAFTCDTSGGLRGAVTSGLAVAPLSRSNIPDGARELTLEDGFPTIDSSRVVLKRTRRHARPAIDGLADMIRRAFQPPTVSSGDPSGN